MPVHVKLLDQCYRLLLVLLMANTLSKRRQPPPRSPFAHLRPLHPSLILPLPPSSPLPFPQQPMYTMLMIACLQAQKEANLAQEAELETVQAAEQQLRQQLSSSSSSSAALQEVQAESESLRQQLQDSARKYNTVKQARERAMTEVSALKTSQPATAKNVASVTWAGSHRTIF